MLYEIVLGLGISYFLLFLLSLVLRDNSIVDIFWGIGFIQVAIHSWYINPSISFVKIGLFIFVVFWGTRLAYHISKKKLHSKQEDPRYQKWRKTWKFFYLRSIFQIYLLQMGLLVIVSLPLYLLFSQENSSSPIFFIVGISISIIGLLTEIIADKQLYKFIISKEKGIMDKGLWKYTRHPNYFGESLIWLGISIIALPITILSILSYITIFILLRFVSGVPMAEEMFKDNKEYQKYAEKTPAFFPKLF